MGSPGVVMPRECMKTPCVEPPQGAGTQRNLHGMCWGVDSFAVPLEVFIFICCRFIEYFSGGRLLNKGNEPGTALSALPNRNSDALIPRSRQQQPTANRSTTLARVSQKPPRARNSQRCFVRESRPEDIQMLGERK